jgi:hypothetical protein
VQGGQKLFNRKESEEKPRSPRRKKGSAILKLHDYLKFTGLALLAASVFSMTVRGWTQSSVAEPTHYLGFDRNDYPGDENLKVLRQTFSFAGYWLNNPPGEESNTWTGRRRNIESAGLGFLVLFNGRLYAQLKSPASAVQLGKGDAQTAASSARREGFRTGTIIFLDQEQGGRMLPEQKAYIYAWVDGVAAAGFRAGIYCSGIAAQEAPGVSVVTAEDIRRNAGGRRIVYFVTDDACPPSPGCVFLDRSLNPTASGISFADIWQFAQSPRRPEVAARCTGYSGDGECYPPGIDSSRRLHVDVDMANSADPSQGRER